MEEALAEPRQPETINGFDRDGPIEPTPQPEPTPQASMQALEQACNALASAIAESVMSQVQGFLSEKIYGVIRTETAKLKRPKVLVVGPKEDQQRILERDFDKLLDLKFVPSHDLRRAGELARTCPHVLVWSDFVGHAETKHIPHKTLVSGGMSALKQKLTQLAAA